MNGDPKRQILLARNGLVERIENVALPTVIEAAGSRARARFLDFFVATIRNPNTRAAYARAARTFFNDFCAPHELELADIRPRHVAIYIEALRRTHSPASVKAQLSALRRLFSYLAEGGIIDYNPAVDVKGPKLKRETGTTPVLSSDQVGQLLGSIDTDSPIGLRDRAILAVMLSSWARVSAVIGLRRKDYRRSAGAYELLLREKGGKERRLPVHPAAEACLSAYLRDAGVAFQPDSPLFPSAWSRFGSETRLTDRSMHRADVYRLIQRRARKAGLYCQVSCHMTRATGITEYLKNGGDLEHARIIAGHEDIKTTRLYARLSQEISAEEISRVPLSFHSKPAR